MAKSCFIDIIFNVGRKQNKAFSLLEVIVGTFVFLVIMSALQGYWITVSRMMESSRARMAVGFVAEELMEDIMAKGYERTGEIEPSGSLGLEITMHGKPKTYSIKYTVNIIDVTDELKSIEVNLSATGAKDMRFETLLCKGI